MRAKSVAVVTGLLMLLAGGTPSASAAPQARAVDCARLKCIALTYDDGPAAASTGALLAHLRARGAKATFFMVGAQAARHPAMAARVAAGGHEIGNHTYSHKDLRKLSPAKIRTEVARSAAAIRRATGRTPALMRPPYGAHDAKVRSAVGAPLIMWSIDTRDWADRNASVVASRVIAQARPGAIVLMHDIHATTAAAAPRILDTLAKRGYTFVTVSELLGNRRLAKGAVYAKR
ncbi:polysaccharide deacetylase family protein [Yinghuangia soli]|uniref:Polysaccharide deacetylase family protein n=1 Tax=Yinghuangia soli TaxID=2908204 RepID=A0AA41TZZ7_9ACTN|nr:polysaccharide deacetylase family protein [Yinghuangia soli]MCF2529318.1 polysaccharide deacetylase family protein [Yinghuangia soli]